MPETVKQIEWDHMHHWKYLAYNSCFMFSLDAACYPAAVVRTRLQIQRCDKLYKSTWDAFKKIAKHEGFGGLYRGFLFAQIGIITGASYLVTYEVSRKKLSYLDEATRGFIAGFAAGIVDQCINNPVQVVLQRRMLEGQQITPQGRKQLRGAARIVFEVYSTHGPKGLYRGFVAALLGNGLDSAMWWAFYGVLLQHLGDRVPDGTPHVVVQGTAGALSAFATTVIGNPLDIIRTRMQVKTKCLNF